HTLAGLSRSPTVLRAQLQGQQVVGDQCPGDRHAPREVIEDESDLRVLADQLGYLVAPEVTAAHRAVHPGALADQYVDLTGQTAQPGAERGVAGEADAEPASGHRVRERGAGAVHDRVAAHPAATDLDVAAVLQDHVARRHHLLDPALGGSPEAGDGEPANQLPGPARSGDREAPR